MNIWHRKIYYSQVIKLQSEQLLGPNTKYSEHLDDLRVKQINKSNFKYFIKNVAYYVLKLTPWGV